MSKATYEKLEEAIREHISEEMEGGYLTDWVLMTASATAETAGRTGYFAEYSESSFHAHLGLANMLVSDVHVQGVANTVDPEE